MLTILKKTAIAGVLSALTLAAASPAQARDGYRRGDGGDDAAIAIGAGVVGLALGAALASGSRDRYYDDDYYYEPRGYYYRSYPRYYSYDNDYYRSYPQRNWRGDGWRGRRDRGWYGDRGWRGRGDRGRGDWGRGDWGRDWGHRGHGGWRD